MPKRIFAANWKMHHDPMAATKFALKFQEISSPNPARDLWFFPPAVSLAATAEAFERRPDVSVGAQNVHWEAKGRVPWWATRSGVTYLAKRTRSRRRR